MILAISNAVSGRQKATISSDINIPVHQIVGASEVRRRRPLCRRRMTPKAANFEWSCDKLFCRLLAHYLRDQAGLDQPFDVVRCEPFETADINGAENIGCYLPGNCPDVATKDDRDLSRRRKGRYAA
jgi:hypothetical protein